MGYITAIAKQGKNIISKCLPYRKISQAIMLPFKKSKFMTKTDTFVHQADEVFPKYIQQAIESTSSYEPEKIKFFKDLYAIDSKKCEYILKHKYFGEDIPCFADSSFLKAVKEMPEKELKETFDEIEKLYKTLPKTENYNVDKKIWYEIEQFPDVSIISRLAILKQHNKAAYEYVINYPDKKRLSSLLEHLSENLNGTTFETLTIPQIRQIQNLGQKSFFETLPKEECKKFVLEGSAAKERFIEYSDSFYDNPQQVEILHKYLNLSEVSEPFTAFRTERDVGMFNSIKIDKSMALKLKFLALKNIFKAKKVKIHDYNGKFDNLFRLNKDLFSHIMYSKELTLADAMEMAKYGNDKFRRQVIELIKLSSIKDTRFKSLTFDKKFAEGWSWTQDGHTKILHNATINKGLHGGYAHGNNRQSEVILDNEEKLMKFDNIKYDSARDCFYMDTSISVV